MPIKDKQKAREYKRLWMAKHRQQQKGNVEPVEPNNFVEPLNVEPKTEKVEPLASVEPKLVEPSLKVEPVEPKKENVEPIVEPEKIMEPKNNEPICFHCQKYPVLDKGAYCLICPEWIKERQEWKARVFKRDDIIKGLQNELSNKNNSSNTNITQQENQAENKGNVLSMPNLYQLIAKHKKIQSIQWKYSEKDNKEREFLKDLLDKLWSFAG